MNLRQVRIVLRERDNFGIFDLALRFLLVLAPGSYAKLSCITLLPALGVCTWLRWGLEWEWGAVWLCAIALAALVQAPFTVLAGRVLLGESPSLREVSRATWRRSGAYLVALVLQAFFLGLGALLLAVWLLPWVGGAYLREAVLLEEVSGGRAHKRSRQIMAGASGRAFGLVSGIALATFGAVIGADILGYGISDMVLQLSLPVGTLSEDGGSLYALIGFFGIVPFVVTARFLAYIDMRARRDGWDLQVRFMDVAAAAQPRAT